MRKHQATRKPSKAQRKLSSNLKITMKTLSESLWYVRKAMFKGKCIALRTYKQEKVNNKINVRKEGNDEGKSRK